jgi:hypothetical protein
MIKNIKSEEYDSYEYDIISKKDFEKNYSFVEEISQSNMECKTIKSI